MTAKEMFEEIGYKFITIPMGYNSIRYQKGVKVIYFRSDKVIIPYEEIYDEGVSTEVYLSIPELNAINKQVEELGWNNE